MSEDTLAPRSNLAHVCHVHREVYKGSPVEWIRNSMHDCWINSVKRSHHCATTCTRPLPYRLLASCAFSDYCIVWMNLRILDSVF